MEPSGCEASNASGGQWPRPAGLDWTSGERRATISTFLLLGRAGTHIPARFRFLSSLKLPYLNVVFNHACAKLPSAVETVILTSSGGDGVPSAMAEKLLTVT